MEFASIIAQEIASLPLENQVEVLEFIIFLKSKQGRKEAVTESAAAPMTLGEIKAFFRSFKVDTSNFKFDRDEANAR
jgi:hypothetical protein